MLLDKTTSANKCDLAPAVLDMHLPQIIQKINTCLICFISCYPNAGLPNPMSDTGFDETPEVTSRLLKEFAEQGLVNIVGGCCGTTPEHIGAIGAAVGTLPARGLGQGAFYRDPA